MKIPGCCSQSLLCSHRKSVAAGDVLHIPWAQDLLLVSFCGRCELQLALYVSPVEQSVSNVAWNPLFAKLVSNCMWRRGSVSQHQPVSLLCHSYCVHLTIILLFYITHICTCHLLQACLCIKHSVGMWNSCCWKRNTSSWFKSCMGHNLITWFFFTPNTLTCYGFSVSLETLK